MTPWGGQGPVDLVPPDERCDDESLRPDLLLDHLPCGFVQCRVLRDDDGEVRDARVVRANPSLVRMLGISLDNLAGRTLSELTASAPPELADWWATLGRLTALATDERALPCEQRLSVRGVPVSVQGYHAGPDQFAATVSAAALPEAGADADERRAIWDLYRQLSDRAARAAIILVVEGEGGCLVDANDAACRLTGYSREELLRLDPNDLVSPEYRPLGGWVQGFLSSDGHATLEATVVHRDGVVTPVEVTTHRYLASGRPAILALLRDTSAHVQAQETLRQRERELRALVAALDDIVFEMDDELRYANVWAKDEHLLFAPREQLLGRTMPEVLGEERGSLFATFVRQAMESGVPVTIEYPSPDSSAWFSARIAPIDDGYLPAKRTVTVVRDVTAHKQADEQLRRSEEEFRSLWENSPIAIELYDRDGVVVRANQAAFDLFGVNGIADVRGFSFFDDPSITEESKQALRRGEPVRRQFRYSLDAVQSTGLYRTSKSGYIDIDSLMTPLRDAQGNVSGYLVHIQDVTERVRAQAALEESERRYRAIVEDQLDLVVRYLPDCIITFANEAFCQFVDLPREQVIGTHNWPAAVPGEESVFHVGTAWFSPERPVRTSEHRVRTPGGEIRWQQWTDRAFFDSSGNVVELQSVGRDITELVTAREALERSEEQFRSLWENSPIAIEVLDRDGRLVAANRASLENHGVKNMADVVGLCIFEDPGVPEESKAALRRGEAAHHQWSYTFGTLNSLGHYRADGVDAVDLDVSITPLFDAEHAVRGYLLQSQDISERVKAQKALEESESRYRAIVEDQLELVVRYLPDSTITFANDAFCRSVGLPREQVIGTQNWPGVVPGDEPDAGVSAGWFSPERQVRTSEHRAVAPDGEVRWQQWVDRAFFDSAGNVVELQSVGRDITELMRAREALQKSELRYRLLFQQSMTGFSLHEVIVDAAGHPCDYVFLEVNPAFENTTGLRREDIVGRRVLDVLPDVEPMWIERYGRVALTGEPDHFEDYSRSVGRYYEVRAYSPQPGQFAVLSLDVTERKLAERALRESEERYRLLAENMQDTLFYHDTEGRLRYVNPAVESLTEYTVGDFLSGRQTPIDCLHPEDRARAAHCWADAVDFGIASSAEYRILTKSGECKWVSASFSPVYDQQSRQVGAHALVADVTERHRLQEQLLQAQKMESIGRLAGGVAHDFNNILTAINGYAEFVLEQLDEDAEIRADVLEVIHNTERASNLTRQLLAFSRKQTMAMRPTDLNALVSDLGRMLRRLIGEHIELVLLPGVGLATVRADPAQIEQVLANLAVNARDAMPGGGTLTIATSNVHWASPADSGRSSLPLGSYVCLEVTDTGHGMTEDVLGHLFEPFFTTKEVGKGTGLGLATIYGIVKQHGGDIVVHSEVGHGSVFSVYLPAALPEVAPLRAETAAVEAGGGETVLLVEDEAAVRATVRRALDRLGYRVIEASNGAEAIELLAQTGIGPALVVTDLVMPSMGGLELIRALRATYPTLRVLFTSGYTEDTVALTTAVEKGSFYLQKPFNITQLAAKVREALQHP